MVELAEPRSPPRTRRRASPVEPEPKAQEEYTSSPRLPLPGTERPNTRYLAAWFSRQWERWAERRRKDEELRLRVYRTRQPTHIAGQGEGSELIGTTVRSGTVKMLLREFTGILAGVPPRIEAFAQGVGPVKQTRADDIEQWDNGWFQAIGGERIDRLVVADQILYGRGVSVVLWAPQFWRDMPEQEKKESDDEYQRRMREWKTQAPLPIVWRYKPAPQCLWDDDDWAEQLGPPRACSWELRPISELAARYPNSKLARDWLRRTESQQEYDDPLRLYICWANRRYTIYASAGGVLPENYTDDLPAALLRSELDEWEILQPPQEHHLGRNPFVVQSGEISGDPELANRYEGLFDNSLDLVDRLDDALTQYGTLVRRYARAVPIITRAFGPGGQIYGVNPTDGSPRVIEWTPDRVQSFLPGENPGWWAPDIRSLGAAIQYQSILSQLIQRDTLAPSTFGAGTAAESGFMLVTLIGAAARKLLPLLAEKGRALETVLLLVHRWVVQVGEPDGIWVPVYSRRGEVASGVHPTLGSIVLTPKQALSARNRVTATAKLEAGEAAKMQLALQIAQVVASGAIDIDQDWLLTELIGVDSPQSHHDAAAIHRFLRSPELENWVVRGALERADMLVQKDESALVAQLARLSPQELLLIPQALQQVLLERGLLTSQMLTPPGAGVSGVGGVEGMVGLPTGGAQTGMLPSTAATLSGVAPPLPPSPVTGGNVPGSPSALGVRQPVQRAVPTQVPQADFVNLGLGHRAGTPRTPREAGI